MWEESAQDLISDLEDFVDFINEIGLTEWREKEERYKFADIYRPLAKVSVHYDQHR